MSVASLAYNGTAPDGGDSRIFLPVSSYFAVNFNLNLWYTTGDVGWIITASALVLFMIPGVGFFYSGLTGTKSALSLIMLSFISISVVSFQVLTSSLPIKIPSLMAAVVLHRLFACFLKDWK
jgi:ammonium transporter, Amt family